MNNRTNTSGLFIKESLKEFKTHGSLFPSSRFLSERMVEPLLMKDGVSIIELGAGTGAFTKKIISRLPEKSKLLVFEINPKLAEHLRQTIKDKRVIIIKDDAENLGMHLAVNGLEKVDYVVSGLPLANLSHAKRQAILKVIEKYLSDEGVYMQFQYFLVSWSHIRKIFKAKIVGYEYRNFPPAFLYKCQKKKVLL
jgi:phosphatidylethanolamine/phosphatidyl-N-methylethanolamine N-methyltransferase